MALGELLGIQLNQLHYDDPSVWLRYRRASALRLAAALHASSKRLRPAGP
jgi:hypothetical protein